MRKIAAMLMLLTGICAWSGAAVGEMRVWVADGAMETEKAQALIGALSRTFPQEKWTLEVGSGETLDELVMEDRAPALAILTAQEAARWAREELLTDMEINGKIADAARAACGEDGRTFMLPVMIRERRMAVNRKKLREEMLDSYMDEKTHPVWRTQELELVLEEFALSGKTGMELWDAEPGTCRGIAALMESISGTGLSGMENGKQRAECADGIREWLRWTQGLIDADMIGMAESRQAALTDFLTGKTAIFIDWTEADRRQNEDALAESGIELMTLPYPNACGEIVRSMDVIGACGFASGEEEKDALAREAAKWLAESKAATGILGVRGLTEDGTTWIACTGITPESAEAEGLYCEAVRQALLWGEDAERVVAEMLGKLDGR